MDAREGDRRHRRTVVRVWGCHSAGNQRRITGRGAGVRLTWGEGEMQISLDKFRCNENVRALLCHHEF